ncbi:MAG TPA: hypothetical protein VM165_14950 [Planctomycetaceae bacterium]|nr:hypothetical protein [Planctomycetaceae bacterium]
MRNPADPDLVKVTEIFLVPSSFLVAALGTADTNFHRAAVSLVGLIISVLWWICSREAMAEQKPASPTAEAAPHPRRTLILSWLSLVFVVGWLVSMVIHALLWNRPLGG